MTFAFPAYHATRVRFGQPRAALVEQVLIAAQGLGWSIERTTARNDSVVVVARHRISIWSWGETITIAIESVGDQGHGGTDVAIKSSCRGVQCFDWGTNRRNVESLVARLPQQVLALDAARASTGAPVAASTVTGRR